MRAGVTMTLAHARREKPVRRPKGYIGQAHQTIGSDILAVLKTLKSPEQVLGAAEVAKLAAVKPEVWYPISWLLELMETLDAKIGRYGLLRMGRSLFDLSHRERVLEQARSAHDFTAEDLDQRLMSEADAQHGHTARERRDHLHGNARVVGRTRPGRDA